MTLGSLRDSVRDLLVGDTQAPVTQNIATMAYRTIAMRCEPSNLTATYDQESPPADVFRILPGNTQDEYGNDVYHYIKLPVVPSDDNTDIDIDPMLENAMIYQCAYALSTINADKYFLLARQECDNYASLITSTP